MIERPALVRVATAGDERPLYDLLVDMWDHNDSGWGFPYDPALVVQHIEEGTRPVLAQRSNPMDQRRAVHGVIDDPDLPGRLIASVGIFIDQVMWFTRDIGPTELWFYIRPYARNRKRYEVALREFSFWVHQELRKGTTERMPLITGFMHQGSRFAGMERLWQRLWGKRAKRVGALWWID